jgi:hypothetical protein
VSELSDSENLSPSAYKDLIPARAQAGDMALVMKTYEREIQRPILSLLFGDLLRGLLIQVQKVKIDGEAAMLAADQVLRSNEINFNIVATVPVVILSYLVYDFARKFILKSSWSSKKVKDKVRKSKMILSELEQLFILHLQATSVTSHTVALPAAASGHLGLVPPQPPAARFRPNLHARFSSLSICSMDDFAHLSSQEVEAEDEALRMATPRADELALDDLADEAAQEHDEEEKKSGPPPPRSHRRMGSEVFGRDLSSNALHSPHDDAAQQLSDEEADELLEEWAPMGGGAPGQPSAAAAAVDGLHGPLASSRTLFPPQAAAPAAPSACSILNLSNHAYGHTLLLIHQLSLLFASLPLGSAFSAASLSSTLAGAEADPRLILHRDLLLLASHELTPDQKIRWLLHMHRLVTKKQDRRCCNVVYRSWTLSLY